MHMLLTIKQGLILSLVLLSTVFSGGCSYRQPRTLADREVDIITLQENGARLEQLIAETDRKVAEIYSHLYVIQAKVYSNENEIEALKAQSTPDTTPSVSDVLSKVSEPAPAEETEKTPSQPTPSKKSPTSLELNPKEAYKNAYAAYRNGLYKKAISLLTQFVEEYPKHSLTDNSQYWIGESYYDMKDYKSALQAFKKVIEEYWGGNKMPDALLKTGYSYFALKDYQNARTFLTQVVKDYPFSSSAQHAEVKLRKIEEIEGKNMQ
jgi:tol-pal system protein YbgF